MGIEKINIEHFLKLSEQYPVLDVRSPSEYAHAYIPCAYSFPLFSDEERKIVGTIYKQQSRQEAIKTGMDFFGIKMKMMVEEAEGIIAGCRKPMTGNQHPVSENTVLIHCWRGGMRSGAVAWLLDLYGFKVYTLAGGYKTFRNWVLGQFYKSYNFKILGGFTGSGKTELIKELYHAGKKVINLERLANHKGSAFGDLGEEPQPSQEMFENFLALELFNTRTGENHEEIWIEDESQRIGKNMIPNKIWEQMREAKIYFLDVNFEDRLDYLTNTYGNFEKEKLISAIQRIQKN